MVRISKQMERRNTSPRKHRAPSKKTGTVKQNLSKGFKEHANSLEGGSEKLAFIPKIR